MKDKGTAAILAFFLGPIGIHRFYLGQSGLGVVYLLLCWTPIIWFIAFIDFIVLLTYSKSGFDAKYNQTYHRQQFAPQQTIMQNNVYVQPAPNYPSSAPPIPSKNLQSNVPSGYEALERLHGLKEKGIISEEEFALEKSKILGNPPGSDRNYNSSDPFLS